MKLYKEKNRNLNIEIPAYETVSAVYQAQNKRRSLLSAALTVFLVL